MNTLAIFGLSLVVTAVLILLLVEALVLSVRNQGHDDAQARREVIDALLLTIVIGLVAFGLGLAL